jgi:hypothetical protein
VVLDWFRRLRKVTRKLALPSRDATSGRSGVQLNPAKLTPAPELYLARLSYLLETASEVLSEQSHSAPTERLSKGQLELSEKYASKSKSVDQLLGKLVSDPGHAKEAISESVEQFHQYTLGRGWYENLIRLHIGYGILQETFKFLEPLTSELIAAHTQRMDALGLTA